MIRQESKLNVADNSGAKILQCIRVLGGTRKKYAGVGSKIVAVVKKALSKASVKKKEVVLAVIVRTKKKERRPDNSYIGFSDNAAVIIDRDNRPVSTGVGVVSSGVREDFPEVVSGACEVY